MQLTCPLHRGIETSFRTSWEGIQVFQWSEKSQFFLSENTILQPNDGLIVGHRLRRWPTIEPSLSDVLYFSGCDVGCVLVVPPGGNSVLSDLQALTSAPLSHQTLRNKPPILTL